jgi:hypothetical protein
MPTPFAVTTASNSVFLDTARTGTAQFTVSNQSGRSIEGRALLVTDAPEAESWVSLRGPAHRAFATAGTEQYTVEIDVPPDAPSGNYTLRLDVVGEERPDEQYVEGPSVTFQVSEAEPAPEPFPWKIVAAIGALLLVGGGVLAYHLSTEEVSVAASFTVDPEAPNVGDEITLDASASAVTGAENLTYSWDFVPPEESGAAINALEAETARFTADVRGDYEIELEVSAREVSDFDTMTVLVEMPTEEVQTEETAEGLGIRLAAPGAVIQNEEFVIRVAITNERPEPTTLTLSSSCLTQIGVYDGPENVRMEGTGRLCLAAITNREFSSGETQESVFDVSAELGMGVVGTGGEIPLGTYTIRASPNVRAIGGEEATLPSVEQDLIVF